MTQWCLTVKNLHRFFNKADIPWVHLVWEKYYKMASFPITLWKVHSGGGTSSSC
jgi:hypothetical protein